MNMQNLPNFITFKNFNDETIELIAKKDFEVNNLNAVVDFKRFLKIFEDYPNLKSLNLKVDRIADGDSMVLFGVHSTFLDGSVVKNETSMLGLIGDILGYENPQRMVDICRFVISRDVDSRKKLKSVFGIENLSDEDIDKMVGNDFFLARNNIFTTMDDINKLHNQIVVIKILTLFKKNNNLKRINLEVERDVVGDQNIRIKVFLNDMVVDNENANGIVEEIKNILRDKRVYDPDIGSDLIKIELNRNSFSDIKHLIKCLMPGGINLNEYCTVLENEILEDNIKPSVAKNKFKKI